MEQVVEFIFAKPVNMDYFEFSINSLERVKWIQRDELSHFISNNVPQSIISIAEIKELVDTYQSFVIDNTNKEWYTLEFDFDKRDITNTVKARENVTEKSDPFTKVMDRIKSYKLKM
ncbi:MAG: hypothetical protein PF569_04910 [Candidatus Woesearchaeota archaeon]|jgi:hypothetical protein|nr:hypothetical protein [Candidatus Woesearchaeota archaeon]